MTDQSTPGALDPDGGERAKLERAIKATEYKYFGDYEMSDDQREAVDVLVECAEQRLAALRTPPTPAREAEVLAYDALTKVGRKLMTIEDAVPTAKEAQRIILDALAAIRTLIPPGAGEASQAGGEVA